MSLRYLVLCGLALGATTLDANAAQEVRRAEFSLWKSANCPGNTSCAVSFGTVPALRAWLIKYVSCYTAVGDVNGKILYWYLYANHANGTRVGEIHLRPTSLGISGPARTYNATEQGYLRVPAGGIVGATMTRDASTPGETPFLNCTIGGDNIVYQ